jgi:Fur family iron response transcriptional regulator
MMPECLRRKGRKQVVGTWPANRKMQQLRGSGCRPAWPTRQRVALAGLLFRQGDRHVSAESLHEEAAKAGFEVSLATVYNTLHQFTEAGLLQQVVVDAGRSYFDTNTRRPPAFLLCRRRRADRHSGSAIAIAGVPKPPKARQSSAWT